MNPLFIYYPWLDKPKERKKVMKDNLGPHSLLRRLKAPIRERLAELLPHHNCPRTFLFGSPHLDNYVRTNSGVGLADFDRALIGPYVSDWCYSLLSLALKQADGADRALPDMAFQAFVEGYQQGLNKPNQAWPIWQPLAKAKTKDWELDPRLYLESEQGWAKKARKNPIPTDDRLLEQLLTAFFASQQQPKWQKDKQVVFAGIAKGSLGRIHTIVGLTDEAGAVALFDLKPALDYRNQTWPHMQWYGHDFAHEGERMCHASQKLAPGVTTGEGFATVNGCQYWGRQLPTLNRKIKHLLSATDIIELAEVMGWQMGRGHAHASGEKTAKALLEHSNNNAEQIYRSIDVIRTELLEGWRYYKSVADS